MNQWSAKDVSVIAYSHLNDPKPFKDLSERRVVRKELFIRWWIFLNDAKDFNLKSEKEVNI